MSPDQVIWTSPDGEYVVVRGPVPADVPRYVGSRDANKAQHKQSLSYDRPLGEATFAKMRATVFYTLVNRNHPEWGEYGP